MTADTAKTLKPNDKVRWTPDGTEGDVIAADYHSVQIEWADGQWSIIAFYEDRWKEIELI